MLSVKVDHDMAKHKLASSSRYMNVKVLADGKSYVVDKKYNVYETAEESRPYRNYSSKDDDDE